MIASFVIIFKNPVVYSLPQIGGFEIFVLIVFFLLVFPLLPGLGFVAGLWGFHTYVSFANVSTNEYLKEQWKSYGMNPFKRNPLLNIWRVLSYPAKKSFLSMRVVDYKKKYIDEIAECRICII